MKKRPKKAKNTPVLKPKDPSRDEQAMLLPLSMIRPAKNIREKLEDIESLAESIRANGLLQPLIVCKRGGQFVLVAGQRRYKALQLLKQTHAPVHGSPLRALRGLPRGFHPPVKPRGSLPGRRARSRMLVLHTCPWIVKYSVDFSQVHESAGGRG